MASPSSVERFAAIAAAIVVGAPIGMTVNALLTARRMLGPRALFLAQWLAAFVGYLSGIGVGVAIAGPRLFERHGTSRGESVVTVPLAFVSAAFVGVLFAAALAVRRREDAARASEEARTA